MWDYQWIAWWQHKKMKTTHNNQPKWLGQAERMEAINDNAKGWTIIEMPKMENGKREWSRKLFFLHKLFICVSFFYKMQWTKHSVQFEKKIENMNYFVPFCCFKNWRKTKNTMRRNWPSMHMGIEGASSWRKMSRKMPLQQKAKLKWLSNFMNFKMGCL